MSTTHSPTTRCTHRECGDRCDGKHVVLHIAVGSKDVDLDIPLWMMDEARERGEWARASERWFSMRARTKVYR